MGSPQTYMYAPTSGMRYGQSIPCHQWSKTKESGDGTVVWNHPSFFSLWAGMDCMYMYVGNCIPPISCIFRSAEYPSHHITPCTQLARSHHPSVTVYTHTHTLSHTCTHTHINLQWGSTFLPPSHWLIQGQCSSKVCIQVKNKGKKLRSLVFVIILGHAAHPTGPVFSWGRAGVMNMLIMCLWIVVSHSKRAPCCGWISV